MTWDKPLKTNCQKKTIVEVHNEARARATPLGPSTVDFDVELDVKAKPRCHIDKAPCSKGKYGNKCLFNVVVDLDFDARVLPKPCSKTSVPVCIDVETKHVAKCQKDSSCHGGCSGSSYSKSTSTSHSCKCRSIRRH